MNLIYIIAFDLPGYRENRTLAKILCCSLLRNFWAGKIIVFRNTEYPLFPVARQNLEEIFIESLPAIDGIADQTIILRALRMRFDAADLIPDPHLYDKVIYIDADCLVARDIEHLFISDHDIIVQPEYGRILSKEPVFNGYLHDFGSPPTSFIPFRRGSWLTGDGLNAGTVCIRGSIFKDFMSQWKEIFESEPARHDQYRDQTAFNRLILDTNYTVGKFEKGEIMFPLHINQSFLQYKEAAILHFLGGSTGDKIDLSFGLYMSITYGDRSGLFLDILEF
jgi:hypothetical protein